MVKTLNELINKARSIPIENSHDSHALGMDLIDSMLRHLTVVSIAAYRHAKLKDSKINQEIAQKLPWPSMGNWQSLLRLFVNADPNLFPKNFHVGFLSPLSTKIKSDQRILDAYNKLIKLNIYSRSRDEQDLLSNKIISCSLILFLEQMVTYRNSYLGHSKHSFEGPIVEFAPIFLKGAIAICKSIQQIWNDYPIYISSDVRDSDIELYKLESLSIDSDSIVRNTAQPGIRNNRLYVIFNNNPIEAVSLYPLVRWDNDDILFMNGTLDYKKIKYLGYLKKTGGMFVTEEQEKDFCDFIAPFTGVKSFNTVDLKDARELAEAMDLIGSDWSLPNLHEGIKIGSAESSYELVEFIGKGGMAEVWRAKSLRSRGNDVAIKFLSNAANTARFRREARALSKISTYNDRTVQFIDFQFNPHPSLRVAFLVMELLPGRSLKDFVGKPDSYTIEQVLDWLEDTLIGLKSVHKAGAVHRDIKPANLMFDHSNHIKLGDLGLVGTFDEQGKDLVTSDGQTSDGRAIGTFAYCSREQLTGDQDQIGPKSDLFSVGASFYHLLTGILPFGEGTEGNIIEKQLAAKRDPSEAPKPINSYRDDCPDFLNNLILGLLNVTPDFRPDLKSILTSIKSYRTREKYNLSSNIMGHHSLVKFQNLLPGWLSHYIFKIWPTIVLFCFMSALVVSGYYGHQFEIQSEALSFNADETLTFFPLFKDFQFLIWVVLPLVGISFLFRIIKKLPTIMQEIEYLDLKKNLSHWQKSKEVNDSWAAAIKSKSLLGVSVLLAIFMCRTTYMKVINWKSVGIYWSDWRISPAGFLIKESMVFANVLGFAFFSLNIMALMRICTYILRGTELSVDLYNPDKTNGLSAAGKLLSLFLPFLVVVLFGVIALLVINKGQNIYQELLMYVGIIITTGFFFVFVFWPIYPMHQQIKKTIAGEIQLYRGRRIRVEEEIRGFLRIHTDFNLEQTQKLSFLTNLVKDFREKESQLLNYNSWPMVKKKLTFIIIVGFSPLIISLVLFLLT